MKLLVFIAVLKLVTCGYLPPTDYDNRTPSCACDDSQISILAEKVSQLELNLETQRSRSDSLEKRIIQHERKKRQAVFGPVAFTAYLSHWENDLAIGQPVVFDAAMTNEGGFYSTATGKFTVPLDGVYMFSFFIETKHMVDTAVRLVVDGKNMLDAVVEPRHTEQNLQGGNVGVFKLHKGATVWVENYNRQHQNLEGADGYRFSTFTGALLAEVEDFSPTWFEEKHQQIDNLDQQLRNLHGAMESLVNHRRDLSVSTAVFAKSAAMLGAAEEHTALSRALSQLAETEEKIEQLHKEQSEQDFYVMAELLKDYVALLGSVKEVLHERVKTYKNWKDAEATLTKKREVKAKLELAHKTDKISQAQQEITDWVQRVEKGQRDFETISATVRKEVARFDKLRVGDFKTSVIQYLQNLMEKQQQMIKHWEQFLPEAKAIA